MNTSDPTNEYEEINVEYHQAPCQQSPEIVYLPEENSIRKLWNIFKKVICGTKQYDS